MRAPARPTLLTPDANRGRGREDGTDLGVWLDFTMQPLQLYGLAFLLGSYSVATLSDLKRMSAQSEFVSIWAIITIGLFVIDVYLMGTDKLIWQIWAAKWLIIVVFSVLSHEKVGPYFHLATGDVVAIMATAALLTPVLVVVYYILLKVIDAVMAPALMQFGQKNVYPFMPVIFMTTIVVIIGNFLIPMVMVR